MESNADAFQGIGGAYARAWEILAAACEVPPSLELFLHQFREMRRARPDVQPERVAQVIASSYRRIR